MENESKLSQALSRFGEKLNEQVWFQQLKAKWDELDPQSRTYLQFAGLGGSVLLAIIIVVSSIWSVSRLRTEVDEKTALLTSIQSASDEIRRIKETLPAGGGGGAEAGAWGPYLEGSAANAGIDKAAMTVGEEKKGGGGEMITESLFDVTLKKVSIKNIVRFAHQLETGARPVKLRNLSIDTKADPAGYMDAVLSLSAFSLKKAE
jgi:type II secretory pathway component PulM